jgi:hypothetical protein
MKPPLLFHSLRYQKQLLATGTREQVIQWLNWNDPNGIYTDAGSEAEGYPPITLEQARKTMSDQINRELGVS